MSEYSPCGSGGVAKAHGMYEYSLCGGGIAKAHVLIRSLGQIFLP